MKEKEVITVCPEQMGGLPTPRIPSEIRNGVVMAKDGRIVDTQFRVGAAQFAFPEVSDVPDMDIF